MKKITLNAGYHNGLESYIFKDTKRTYYMWKEGKLRASKVYRQVLDVNKRGYYSVQIWLNVAGLGIVKYETFSEIKERIYLSVEDYKNNKPIDRLKDLAMSVQWTDFFEDFPIEVGDAHFYQQGHYGCIYATDKFAFSRYKVNKETGRVKEIPIEIPIGSILIESLPEYGCGKPVFTHTFIDTIVKDYADTYVSSDECNKHKMDDIEVVGFDDEPTDEPKVRFVEVTIRMLV
jgi:hypothetical protein